MKYLITALFLLSCTLIQAQPATAKKKFINEQTVVKDAKGTVYPYFVWQKLLQSGDYSMKAENPSNDETAFILFELTEQQKLDRFSKMPSPPESKYFVTGKAFGKFKTTDINGTMFNLKEMKGKTVVFNFWFINCPPCRTEIPHLNKLVEKYKDNKEVVFIAVALDSKSELLDFLQSTPFNYNVVDAGRWIASDFGINSFPTNVVVDKEGIVRFHASGYSPSLPYWIEKTIEAVAANQPK